MTNTEYYLWREPQSMTDNRPAEEKYCELCGEVIPHHQPTCRLLKDAHKNMEVKCTFCDSKYIPGVDMAEHTLANHRQELIDLGADLSKTTI